MHLPGKKLLGQVLAMKLLVGSGTSSRTDSNPEQTGQGEGEQSQSPAGQGRDRLVYIPTQAENDKPGTAGGEHEEVVYYSAAPAGATPDRLPEARLGSPIRSTPAAPAPVGVADARRSRWHSGELGRSQPAAHPGRIEEPPLTRS